MAAAPFAISTECYGEAEAQAAKHAREFTRDAAEHLKEICLNVSDVSSEDSVASAQRRRLSRRHANGADLIVVGSHGYGFWSRALLGSVSNSVVHHAPCSVLIVRGKMEAKY